MKEQSISAQWGTGTLLSCVHCLPSLKRISIGFQGKIPCSKYVMVLMVKLSGEEMKCMQLVSQSELRTDFYHYSTELNCPLKAHLFLLTISATIFSSSPQLRSAHLEHGFKRLSHQLSLSGSVKSTTIHRDRILFGQFT